MKMQFLDMKKKANSNIKDSNSKAYQQVFMHVSKKHSARHCKSAWKYKSKVEREKLVNIIGYNQIIMQFILYLDKG